jgi:hypothetical protein
MNEPMNEVSVEELLRDAVASVETLPPPLDAFRDSAAHEQRRLRRRTQLVAGAAAVLGLLVTATWLGTRSDGDSAATARPVVTMVENPANIAWWADGSLHLANVTVEVPPSGRRPDHLAQINGGAVYGDDDTGAVVFVGDDGEVTRIGTKAPGARLVASDENGWVAWVDPRAGSPELVVYDLTARGVLASRPLPSAGSSGDGAEAGGYPIALDGDEVFYAAEDGEHAWTVPDGATERVEPSGLLAVASGTRVWQVGPTTITMEQPFFSLSFDRAGSGAQMSPDGNRVLTRTSDTGAGGTPGAVHLYDTRSGEALWTGLTRRDVPIAATLGPETEVSYLLAYRDDESRREAFVRQSSSSPVELRTCDHEVRRCRAVVQIPLVGAAPVLAR